MDNPLASSGGVGYFRAHSAKNKSSDLSQIRDRKSENLIVSGNTCKFPKKIFVINLDRRQDRWEITCEKNKEFFGNFQVERFSAVEGANPVDSIFESFLRCLEKAFQTEETVIIMEDDCYVAEGALKKLKEAFESLPFDWDCLIGNHYFIGQIEILSDHLAKPVIQASTLNFSIFNKTILDKIKNNLDKRNSFLRDIDHFITNSEVPIDNFTVWPMISREWVSYSDHKGSIKDMTIRIREHANLYQFIDSETYYPSLEDW